MEVSLELIKDLRNATLASIADCKNALVETKGDLHKAIDVLRKRGLEIAAKKVGRAAKEGRIEAYIHQGSKMGVLLEVNCETDFVAKSPDFCQFTKDVAMQVAACNPQYLKKEDVSAEIIEQENDKDKFYKAHCLLEQPFVKDPKLTINECLGSLVGKMGENIVIRKFMRYKIGE